METVSEVKIRLIKPHETPRWMGLIQEHHYIGAPVKFFGERLLYVAVDSQDNWLALIGWCSATPQLEDRETWIDWSNNIRKKRLKYIANNFRFLILPGEKPKNFASKILSLNLKVLSRDWLDTYKHEIYLVETFVDKSKFYGGCYRAANWLLVGETKGFSRTSKGDEPYEFHGIKKLIFVRALRKNFKLLLSDPQFRFTNCWNKEDEVLIIDVHKLPVEGKNSLMDALRKVDDKRQKQGRRHGQLSILCLAACAMLSGAKGFKGIFQWASKLTRPQRLKLRIHGDIPSMATIRRVLINLDSAEFDRIVCDWLFSLASNDKIKGLSVDGKVLKGTKDDEQKTVHLLSALMHDEKITIAQAKIDDKENEIPAFKPLLAKLPLAGTVITADAMHCQVDHAEFLINEKQADYAFVVKGNQPTLFEAMQKYLSDIENSFQIHERIDSAHGRIDSRKLTLLPLDAIHKKEITFPFATHICKIQRISEEKKTGKTTNYYRYFITSISESILTAESMMNLILKHWQIESGHWVRDEIFQEDKSRIRKNSGAQVMATIRNLSIGILRFAGAKNINEGVQEMGWSNARQSLRSIGLT